MNKTKHITVFGYSVKFSTITMVVVIFALALTFLGAMLFAPWPAIHDPTHWIRHSLGFIPCH